MNIDVIIPVYNSKKTIRRVLYSIAYQKYSEYFNVYLVNDFGSETYEEEISFFSDNLNIKELKMSYNGGPGIARQYGIDNSYSEYIVFIDSDDYFYSPHAIYNMYKKIDKTKSDVLISNFIYERDNEISIKENNMVWLHGKMYKRKFLVDKNIRFNHTRANEDNGFNRLVFLCGAKVCNLNEITYVYSDNSSSITRKDNREYKFSGLEWYSYNMAWAMKECLTRGGETNEVHILSLNILVSLYYYYLDLYSKYDVSKILEWCVELKKIYLNYGNLEKDEKLLKKLLLSYKKDEYKNKKINYVIDFFSFFEKIGGDLSD